MELVRARGARSRPPARARKLDCANCGAPLESMRGTRCGYCQNEVGGGRLDWLVTSVERVRTEPRAPLVTSTAEERGNDLPTLVDPGASARLAELVARDPASTPEALRARIELVFSALQRGWSGRDLASIRPFVTDNLFQYFGYFIDLYQQQRARNVTENARVTPFACSRPASTTPCPTRTSSCPAAARASAPTPSTGRSSAAAAPTVAPERSRCARAAARRSGSPWPVTASTATRAS
jgi:hypothetical protein